MDTTPSSTETNASTTTGGGVNENLGDLEDKDAEMSHIEQNSSNCNNMNLNKRARQISGQCTNAQSMASNLGLRGPGFGVVVSQTNVSPVTEHSSIRDHRMSVSDSGDAEPPRQSDGDDENVPVSNADSIAPSGGSVVSEVLESDGDVRTEDDEASLLIWQIKVFI